MIARLSIAGCRTRLPVFARAIEWACWGVSALCLLLLAQAAWHASVSQRAAERLVEAHRPTAAGGVAPAMASGRAAGSQPTGDNAVIGRLDIDALKLSVPMTAGVESDSLIRGVGHVNGTAMPGGLGTIALAGHRDTYFRPLQHIEKQMDVAITDATGTYHYTVESWEVVSPDDVDVLSIRTEPELVLITCYPFHFVGAAPKRFVVHARLTSLLAD